MTNKKHSNEQVTNDKAQQAPAWSFGLGLVFFILVVFSLITVSWWLSKHFLGQETVPVSSIVISGEMPYSQREDILAAIEQIDLGNFFKVNVNDVQKQVSALPWVYSVAVRKQWPNELKIYVVDQTPVALWNGDFLLNQFGKAFQADIKRITHHLPRFFGPEGAENLALENYSNLNALLDYKNLSIDELVLSERFSWQLTLNDGVTLNLGREERVERVQRFMDVYSLIKAQINTEKQENQAVDYIDLRYDTGLAVGWKSIVETTMGQQVIKQEKNLNV